jgi:hypothetical protein
VLISVLHVLAFATNFCRNDLSVCRMTLKVSTKIGAKSLHFIRLFLESFCQTTNEFASLQWENIVIIGLGKVFPVSGDVYTMIQNFYPSNA